MNPTIEMIMAIITLVGYVCGGFLMLIAFVICAIYISKLPPSAW